MPISDTLRSLSNLGKDLVDSQKTEWLGEAETRLRAIADETTAKLHRTAMMAAGLIAGALLVLSLVLALR